MRRTPRSSMPIASALRPACSASASWEKPARGGDAAATCKDTGLGLVRLVHRRLGVVVQLHRRDSLWLVIAGKLYGVSVALSLRLRIVSMMKFSAYGHYMLVVMSSALLAAPLSACSAHTGSGALPVANVPGASSYRKCAHVQIHGTQANVQSAGRSDGDRGCWLRCKRRQLFGGRGKRLGRRQRRSRQGDDPGHAGRNMAVFVGGQGGSAGGFNGGALGGSSKGSGGEGGGGGGASDLREGGDALADRVVVAGGGGGGGGSVSMAPATADSAAVLKVASVAGVRRQSTAAAAGPARRATADGAVTAEPR